MLPFKRRRKGKKGKESPSWVNYEREERCMVGLARVVDFAGDERHERMTQHENICLFALNGRVRMKRV